VEKVQNSHAGTEITLPTETTIFGGGGFYQTPRQKKHEGEEGVLCSERNKKVTIGQSPTIAWKKNPTSKEKSNFKQAGI